MKIRLSPILIILSVSIVVEIVGSLNYLLINNNGGNALAGTFFFIGLLVSLLLAWIEQSIIRNSKIGTKKLWISEWLIILIVLILILALQS